jgi:hypothetical protein
LISERLAGRTKIRWESDMKDLRIMEVKKLDKMHSGSVKYLKRLTLSNNEVVASDYEEEEVFRGMIPVDYFTVYVPTFQAGQYHILETGIFRIYEYAVLISCRSVLYEDYNVHYRIFCMSLV